MRKSRIPFVISVTVASLFPVLAPRSAAAQPLGAPPPESKALVATPKVVLDVPVLEKPKDASSVTLSAGGLQTTGNSRLLALTANGSLELRRGANGFGASLLGNYGQGGPAGQAVQVSAQNVQGRLRYDRFLVDRLSLFLINTVRHDRFQGLDVRYNLDPGVKYLLLNEGLTAAWAELGYDFQFDVRRDDARSVLDADKKVVLDSNGNPLLLDSTKADHSSRAYLGFRHAFNKEVTFSTGLEYLQSFVDTKQYRLNYDAIFAAKVGGGFSVGFGFSSRYDAAPLPGKEKLDTSTTISLIYAFSESNDKPPPKEEPTCPCPRPPAKEDGSTSPAAPVSTPVPATTGAPTNPPPAPSVPTSPTPPIPAPSDATPM